MTISPPAVAIDAASASSERSVTLSSLPAGSQGILASLRGGHWFRSRLADLGFTTGALITVVQNYGRGPMLVSVRGTLVALGRREAAHVLVSRGES